MRKKTVFFIFFSLFFTFLIAQQKLYKLTFSNGLQVEYNYSPKTKLSYMIFLIDSGEANTSLNTTGIVELLFNSLFGERGVFETSQYLSKNGIRYEIKIHPERNILTFYSRSEEFVNTLKIVLKKFSTPSFDFKVVSRFSDEYSKRFSELYLFPDIDTIKAVIPRIVFGNHPYGKIPDPRRIKLVSPPLLKKFFSENITPNNTTLIIVSNVNPSTLKNEISSSTLMWKKNIIFEEYIPPVEKTENSVVIGNFKKYYIAYGGILPGTEELSEYELEFLKYILFNSYASRAKNYFIRNNIEPGTTFTFVGKQYSLMFFIVESPISKFKKVDSIFRRFVKKNLAPQIGRDEFQEGVESFIGKSFILWENPLRRYLSYYILRKSLRVNNLTVSSFAKIFNYKKLNNLKNQWLQKGAFIYFGDTRIKNKLKPEFYRVYKLTLTGIE